MRIVSCVVAVVTGGAEASDTTTTSPDTSKDKKKKNRCHTCKKKVGLTGMYSCLCHLSVRFTHSTWEDVLTYMFIVSKVWVKSKCELL